jgi:hypothetical protein
MHRYIQAEMEFPDISSLGAAYRYVIKIEQKLKKRHDNLGLGTPHRKIQERSAPTHRTKEKSNTDHLRTTSQGHKKIRTPKI